MTYRQPERCPRCRGSVAVLWQGEYPKCLACGWEDDRKPIRVVDTGIQVPLADDFETERLMFNEPEEVSQWQPGAHAADCGCGPCQAVASTVAALIHDGIRERLDRRGGALDADRELTGRSEAAVGRRQRTHESVVESPSGIPPLAAPGPPMAPPKGTSPPPSMGKTIHHVSTAIRTGGI